MKEKIKQLFGLFGAFAVVGVTTFGGGYAMVTAVQRGEHGIPADEPVPLIHISERTRQQAPP